MNMTCDLCGKRGVKVRRISETHGSGKKLLVIENIPMMTCPHCGESYFTAETLREVERIKIHRRALAVERRVSIASYA